MANRVALDGSVLDGGGFVVANDGLTGYPIAWAQGRYLVSYCSPRMALSLPS